MLKARGIPHDVQEYDGWCRLVVATEDARAAVAELGSYRAENRDWPPPHERVVALSNGRLGAALYVGLIGVLYPAGLRGVFGANLWSAGRLEADRVMAGEWWRAVTALTLHADLRHVAGNAVFGAAFAVLASQVMGSGLAWLATLAAGVLGNLANAWIQRPEHRSIGASTAVFGCLGVLCAYEWMRRHTLRHPPMRRFGPLLGGAVLLGFLGMGGENTDVVAHATGLLSGLALGAAIGASGLVERTRAWRAWQPVCGAFVLAILGVAWALALTHAA